MPPIESDVLVIGGGLSGAWAAWSAARAGASVVLADKGYCGTSGVTATAGPGHWWVPPDPALRAAAVEKRALAGLGLADPRCMARVLDSTWRHLPTLASHCEFPTDDQGVTQYRALRGPEYLRALRQVLEVAGVRILDHSPALELLLHGDASVAGARGLQRQTGEDWTVRAGAVVLATGGCAFLSRLLGAHTNTGDGHLMAAEAGAELSGMEFSSFYTVSPAHSSMTRAMSYAFATYYDAAGRELEIPADQAGTHALARAMLAGPVSCSLHRMPLDIRARIPQVSPNVMLPFVRKGIDPYTQRFQVVLRGEGTVRGVGGLRLADDDCQTRVPGLFAVGDAATREPVTGAISGGGAQNSAWALSSGVWAGQAAARLGLGQRGRHSARAEAIGQAGLRPRQARAGIDVADVVRGVQDEMLPYDKNLFRTGTGLNASLTALDSLWRRVRDHGGALAATPGQRLRLREAAAMVATGRWCDAAALARQESRGMHQRLDAPGLNPRLATRLRTGGLDSVWVRPEALRSAGRTPLESEALA